ncbi:MAG: flagellar protein FlaG [Cellulosilyticaceae bacterium]
MEIGNVIANNQPQVRPVEVSTPSNKNNSQSSEGSSNQNIFEKMKTNPAYEPTIQEEVVIKAIETANKKVSGGPREFSYAIHEKTKEIMVKVIDSETKEIIKEIPPEKILDMVANMWEAAGLFVDEKR